MKFKEKEILKQLTTEFRSTREITNAVYPDLLEYQSIEARSHVFDILVCLEKDEKAESVLRNNGTRIERLWRLYTGTIDPSEKVDMVSPVLRSMTDDWMTIKEVSKALMGSDDPKNVELVRNRMYRLHKTGAVERRVCRTKNAVYEYRVVAAHV